MIEPLISINADAMTAEIAELIGRFRELPRHIARKHLAAAMRRAMKPGVPILRRNTPPLGTRRGRPRGGQRPDLTQRTATGALKYRGSTGALRRSVTAKAKAVPGRSGAGVAYGVLGYRFVGQDRKAIWQEFGTRGGVKPKSMAAKTMEQARGPAAAMLTREMAVALERAAAELASGKNPARTYR